MFLAWWAEAHELSRVWRNEESRVSLVGKGEKERGMDDVVRQKEVGSNATSVELWWIFDL